MVWRRHRGAVEQSIVDLLEPPVRVFEIPKRVFAGRALRRCIDVFRPEVIHGHLRRAVDLIDSLRSCSATVATLHIEANSRSFFRMDGLICNAHWQVARIRPVFSGRILKACNSLTPHPRIGASMRAGIRRSLGIDDGDFFVGGAGRYTYLKGWDQVIAAFGHLHDLPTLRLRLFGVGSFERRLRAMASSDARIRIDGFRSDVKDVLQSMDLVVVPSRTEALPRAILEAMDARVPVVASSVDGCMELLDCYGGTSFQVGDVHGLAEAIRRHYDGLVSFKPPDLSRHHLPRANEAVENFYLELMANRRVAK